MQTERDGSYEVYAGEHGFSGSVISRALDEVLDRGGVDWRLHSQQLSMGLPAWAYIRQVGGDVQDRIVESNEVFTAKSPRAARWLEEAVGYAHAVPLSAPRARVCTQQCACPGRTE